MSAPLVRSARFAELTPQLLYDLLRLRTEVFVVEQRCPYPELDGRDPEPETEHLWVEVDGEAVAVLRILAGEDGPVVGRVATASGHRGQGYAATLLSEALARTAGHRVRLSAQSQLRGWYQRFGFVVDGEEYLDDGIPHVPMVREAAPAGGPALRR